MDWHRSLRRCPAFATGSCTMIWKHWNKSSRFVDVKQGNPAPKSVEFQKCHGPWNGPLIFAAIFKKCWLFLVYETRLWRTHYQLATNIFRVPAGLPSASYCTSHWLSTEWHNPVWSPGPISRFAKQVLSKLNIYLKHLETKVCFKDIYCASWLQLHTQLNLDLQGFRSLWWLCHCNNICNNVTTDVIILQQQVVKI